MVERDEPLRRVLDAISFATAADPASSDAWSLALDAFAASWRLDHAHAAQQARAAASALPDDADATVRVLVHAMLALAAAGTGFTGGWTDAAPGFSPTGDPLEDAATLLDELDDTDAARFARYAVGEAALACARVRLSSRIWSTPVRFAGALAGHPFETVMAVLAARIAAFAGRIDDAHRILDDRAVVDIERFELLALATRSLIAGNGADATTVRRISTEIARIHPEHHDRLESGIVLLCAYGLIALYDVGRSAAMLARFGWQRAMVIDRAIVAELLVHAAVLADDLDAAAAWLESAEQFSGDPITDSTLDRMRSRVRLLAGDPDGALEHALRAIARAQEEGRLVEAVEGEMLAAKARIAGGRRGEAARRLEDVVAETAPGGYRIARRAASRHLRGVGRRLRPVAGGDAVLSPREREVLELILDGCDTAQLAAQLHISPHTARIHTSRVLAAYGAPSRLVLIGRLAAASGDPALADQALAALTARQGEVVREAVHGATNAEIAGRLGVSSRTVEKHLADAMRRWGVSTRVALILRAAGVDPAE